MRYWLSAFSFSVFVLHITKQLHFCQVPSLYKKCIKQTLRLNQIVNMKWLVTRLQQMFFDSVFTHLPQTITWFFSSYSRKRSKYIKEEFLILSLTSRKFASWSVLDSEVKKIKIKKQNNGLCCIWRVWNCTPYTIPVPSTLHGKTPIVHTECRE